MPKRTQRFSSPIGPALVGALALGIVALGSRDAHAFKPEYHAEIVDEALPHLDGRVRHQLKEASNALDCLLDVRRAGADVHHFNDCGFSEASKNIRALYTESVNELAQGHSEEAQQLFGEILHTVQDFYAHTNWLQAATAQSLVAPGTAEWPLLSGFGVDGQTPFVFGEDANEEYPEGWSSKITGSNVEFCQTTPTGQQCYPAIVSGFVGNAGELGAGTQCPRDLAVGHWDSPVGLNQDEPSTPYFLEAKAFAVAQTQVELCRLEDLTRLSGNELAERTLRAWLDRDAAENLCRLPGAYAGVPQVHSNSRAWHSSSSFQRSWHYGLQVGAVYPWSDRALLDARFRGWGVLSGGINAGVISDGTLLPDRVVLGARWTPLGDRGSVFLDVSANSEPSDSSSARGRAVVGWEWRPLGKLLLGCVFSAAPALGWDTTLQGWRGRPTGEVSLGLFDCW